MEFKLYVRNIGHKQIVVSTLQKYEAGEENRKLQAVLEEWDKTSLMTSSFEPSPLKETRRWAMKISSRSGDRRYCNNCLGWVNNTGTSPEDPAWAVREISEEAGWLGGLNKRAWQTWCAKGRGYPWFPKREGDTNVRSVLELGLKASSPGMDHSLTPVFLITCLIHKSSHFIYILPMRV